MNILAEFLQGMRGVWGIVRFRPEAFATFENTPGAVVRSFLAAAIGLPIYIMVLRANLAAMTPQPDLGALLPMMVLYYAIEWLIWPNLMAGVADRLGRRHFYCRYIVAYNWFALAQMLVMLPLQLSMSQNLPPPPEMAVIGLLTTVAFGIYEWFIARHGLEIPSRRAIAVVVLNLMVGLSLLWFKAFQLPL